MMASVFPAGRLKQKVWVCGSCGTALQFSARSWRSGRPGPAGPQSPVSWRGRNMSRNSTKKRVRVLIVDDHPAVREALALRIGRQRDMEVCGEAADVGEAMRLLAETRPDAA